MLSEIKMAAKVYSSDHKGLGRVAYFILSKEDGKLSHFVIKNGFFEFQNLQKVVSIKKISNISDDGATLELDLTRQEFKNLPVLTIYEEAPSAYNDANPLNLHTRLVTYQPDPAQELVEKELDKDQAKGAIRTATKRGRGEGTEGLNNAQDKLSSRFMDRIKIYSDKFVLLGGRAVYRIANKDKYGTVSKVSIDLATGGIASLNLKTVGPAFIQAVHKVSNAG